MKEKCILWAIRIAANLLVVGLLAASGYLVYYVADTNSLQVSLTTSSTTNPGQYRG